MFSQVEQALEHLESALSGVEAASSEELRRALGLSKQLRSRLELLEAKAAAAVSQRERHGDGGAGLLRQHSGLTRSEAARNVRTETELASMPNAQAAVAEGHLSLANAAKLAQTARKTSPDAVQDDPELIRLAKALPSDEFAQAAQRWTIRHQSNADLEAQHRRNRRNRYVRFWNGEDGSVQMRGSFDAEMGARIQGRLRRQAEQFCQADRRREARLRSGESFDPSGAESARSGHSPSVVDPDVRTRDQRMADALGSLVGAATSTASMPMAHNDCCRGESDRTQDDSATSANTGRKPPAEIIVRVDLATLLGESGGIAEICGAGPIAPSAVERIACNSDLSMVILGDQLTPLYEAVPQRAPTAAQRRALIARHGACIGCGAAPDECEAHHIIPWAKQGKTRIDNLVLVCWHCHDLIHDHNWKVVKRDGRYRLIPPDPANGPNPAPSRKPRRDRVPQQRSPAATMQRQSPKTTTRQQSLLAVTPRPPPAAA